MWDASQFTWDAHRFTWDACQFKVGPSLVHMRHSPDHMGCLLVQSWMLPGSALDLNISERKGVEPWFFHSWSKNFLPKNYILFQTQHYL